MESTTWADVLKEHIPLITGSLVAIFVALRIFSAAAYNPETAYGILQASGTGTVIIGSLLSIIGILPAWLFLACTFAYDRIPDKQKDAAQSTYAGVLVLLFLIAIFISPIAYLVVMVFIGGIEIYVRSGRKRGERMIREARARRTPEMQFEIDKRTREMVLYLKRRKPGLSAGTVIIVVLTLWQFTVGALPWLPTEQLNIKGGSTTVGWVLSTDPSFTTVLSVTGQIRYITTDSILQKKICVEFRIAPANRTIPELTSNQTYPSCISPNSHAGRKG
jgi:Ca2+/Na+ antiporter